MANRILWVEESKQVRSLTQIRNGNLPNAKSARLRGILKRIFSLTKIENSKLTWGIHRLNLLCHSINIITAGVGMGVRRICIEGRDLESQFIIRFLS